MAAMRAVAAGERVRMIQDLLTRCVGVRASPAPPRGLPPPDSYNVHPDSRIVYLIEKIREALQVCASLVNGIHISKGENERGFRLLHSLTLSLVHVPDVRTGGANGGAGRKGHGLGKGSQAALAGRHGLGAGLEGVASHGRETIPHGVDRGGVQGDGEEESVEHDLAFREVVI